MSNRIFLMTMVGGVLPDALRILHWARTAPALRSSSPFHDPAVLVGLVIQVGVGLLMAWLLEVSSDTEAVVVGYAGPEFLTRLVAAVARPSNQLGAATATRTNAGRRILTWWREY